MERQVTPVHSSIATVGRSFIRSSRDKDVKGTMGNVRLSVHSQLTPSRLRRASRYRENEERSECEEKLASSR